MNWCSRCWQYRLLLIVVFPPGLLSAFIFCANSLLGAALPKDAVPPSSFSQIALIEASLSLWTLSDVFLESALTIGSLRTQYRIYATDSKDRLILYCVMMNTHNMRQHPDRSKPGCLTSLIYSLFFPKSIQYKHYRQTDRFRSRDVRSEDARSAIHWIMSSGSGDATTWTRGFLRVSSSEE
jgi:hypothetical protein